jgi:Ca2+-binding RTX toxin-like protein
MGAGADTITGGLGNDTITAGGGGMGNHDVISGGGGADKFIFAVGQSVANINTAEVITDFVTGDTLQIGALGHAAGAFFGGDTVTASSLNAGIAQANTDLGAHIYVALQVGSDVVVYIDSNADGHITAADDAIVLTGKALADITLANFV